MKITRKSIALTILSALVTIIVLGQLLPAMISSSHTELVLAGFGIIAVLIYFIAVTLLDLFTKKAPENE